MTVAIVGNIIKANFTPNASGGTDVNVPGLKIGDYVISVAYNNGGGRYINTNTGSFDANVQTDDYLHQNGLDDSTDVIVFLIRP